MQTILAGNIWLLSITKWQAKQHVHPIFNFTPVLSDTLGEKEGGCESRASSEHIMWPFKNITLWQLHQYIPNPATLHSWHDSCFFKGLRSSLSLLESHHVTPHIQPPNIPCDPRYDKMRSPWVCNCDERRARKHILIHFLDNSWKPEQLWAYNAIFGKGKLSKLESLIFNKQVWSSVKPVFLLTFHNKMTVPQEGSLSGK